MIKLFLSILFSITYLTSTSGVSLNTRYCRGKIISVSFFKHFENNCCGKKKTKKNCCNDKINLFKVKDNHQSGNLLKSVIPTYKITDVILCNFDYNCILYNTDEFVISYHAPPILYNNLIYLKYKVLLI